MTDPAAPHPMPASERSRLLATTSLFAGFPPALVDELAAAARDRVLAPGEVLFHAHETSDEMFVVASGTLGVSVNRAGRRIELTRLGPGDLCGEMALLTGEPRSATVAAATASQVVELDRATMARLFHRQPGLMEVLSRNLAVRKRANASVLRQPQKPEPAPASPAAPDHPAGLLDRMRALFRTGK